VLPLLCLRDLLLKEVSIRFNIHSLHKVNESHLVNDGFIDQLFTSLSILGLLGEPFGEPELVNFARSAKPVLLFNADFGCLTLSHALQSSPKTFNPGDVTDRDLDCLRQLTCLIVTCRVLRALVKDLLVIEVGAVFHRAEVRHLWLLLAFADLNDFLGDLANLMVAISWLTDYVDLSLLGVIEQFIIK